MSTQDRDQRAATTAPADGEPVGRIDPTADAAGSAGSADPFVSSSRDRRLTTARDQQDAGATAGGRRRLLRVVGWVVAFGLWSVLCFVWLFPLLTELGLDPTLGG